MNRTFLLLKTQVINYFSLNEIFGQHGGKQGPVFITAAGIFTLLRSISSPLVSFVCVPRKYLLISAGGGDSPPAFRISCQLPMENVPFPWLLGRSFIKIAPFCTEYIKNWLLFIGCQYSCSLPSQP